MPEALWAGILAGYGIAIPVGPIAVLIFDTALHRGLATGAAAGAGAATVDGLYATIAGLLGAAVAAVVAPVIVPARIAGAALLAVIAARGLVGAFRRADGAPPDQPSSAVRSALGTYLTFLGLTIVNPMTLVYFAALVLGLPPAASEGRALFVAGAFAASLSWQLLLALGGSLLHGRLSPRLRAATRIVGAFIVLSFAVRLALMAG